MKNKGFSMVELIIVIAILVVVTGLLAPVLSKYINKARLSVDIDNGAELAKTIISSLTDDDVKDNAVEHATPHKVNDMDGSAFKSAVFGNMGITTLTGKAKKDVDGNALDMQFYYTLDSTKNKVEIFYGGTTEDYEIYPHTGQKLLK